jgi:hypothetical protein
MTATISTAPDTAAPSTNLPARTGPAGKPAATRAGGHHVRAAQRAVAANSTHLDFHVGETRVQVTMPPLDKLAFYAGLAGATALGVIEWPIALVTGVGHLLSDDRRNRTLRALGEALDAA